MVVRRASHVVKTGVAWGARVTVSPQREGKSHFSSLGMSLTGRRKTDVPSEDPFFEESLFAGKTFNSVEAGGAQSTHTPIFPLGRASALSSRVEGFESSDDVLSVDTVSGEGSSIDPSALSQRLLTL